MAKTATLCDDDLFDLRLSRSAGDLWPMIEALYGAHPDHDLFREKLLTALRAGAKARPADLKRLDMIRDLAELAAEGDPCSFVFMRREIKAAHGVDLGRQRAERVCADLGVKPWWK